MLRYGPRVLHALVFSACVGGAGAASAASFKYTALNADGANLVTPLAISAKDQVVGITNNSNNQPTGIFWSEGTLTLVNGTYGLNAINDNGIAVGEPSDGSTNYASYDARTGKVSYIPIPFLQGKNGEVTAEGINDAGTIVGVVDRGNHHRATLIGFDSVSGSVNELLPHKEKQSFPLAINKAGDMLIRSGFTYYDPFVYHNGKFKQFGVPGAMNGTYPAFITDKGEVGGNVTINNVFVGFTMRDGNYTTYSPPGASRTTVTGVGPSGQIYGYFLDSNGIDHGFVDVSGTYYQIDVPSSTSTSISGVGTSGTIFGIYTNSGGSYGFIGKCGKKDVCTQ